VHFLSEASPGDPEGYEGRINELILILIFKEVRANAGRKKGKKIVRVV
jgi:hypothetical protein